MLFQPLLNRALLGVLIASAVAVAARRVRALTVSGSIAGVIVGAACVVGGWDWILLLLFFFITSTGLSHWRVEIKRALVASVVEKGGERDAAQVLANGLVLAVAAIGAVLAPGPAWYALGAGAIAAATADTWGTEIGTVLGGTPRHLLNGAPLSPGMSGGITLAGSVATVLGAVTSAVVVWALHWNVPGFAVVVGGIGGSVIDSLLGASVQERRWCDRCRRLTERRVHSCGSPTRVRGGIPGFGNDWVNLTSILAGAIITRMLS
jgi:uncharacterized protein (TIGR00297 family)